MQSADHGPDPTVLVVNSAPGDSGHRALVAELENGNFAVEPLSSEAEALARCRVDPSATVVLQRLELASAWLDTCRRFVALTRGPVVVAFELPSPLEVVVAFEIGVSAYLPHPPRTHELVSRIRSLLRPPCSGLAAATGEQHPPRRHVIGEGAVQVDVPGRRVTVDGEVVHVSRLEFDLLAALLNPPGQVHSREDILRRVWAERPVQGSRTLDTHVRRLRMKLGDDQAAPRYLVTVRGVGYLLEACEMVETR